MAGEQYNGPDFGFTNTGKSTLNKGNNTYVTTINDPNILHQFASYNALFTLSALSEDDLKNTPTLLNSKAHDIIVRSSGIGTDVNQSSPAANLAKATDGATLSDRLVSAALQSRQTLGKNRDLYIRSVTLNSIPGLNEKRRLTSVTQINMEIIEPTGITLLERIRGAAVNNGYLDHLDAPFMLTIDFKGFDEQGRTATPKDSETMKRLIPLKFIDMQMSVTQAGTVYSVKAIPMTEFGYTNRHNYPRTAGTLSPKGKKLSDVFSSLESLLNKQLQDEVATGQIQKPDIYSITFDDSAEGIKNVVIPMDNLEQTGMQAQKAIGVDKFDNIVKQPLDYMKINSSNAITKILEEIMKGHPDYSDKNFEQWKEKVSDTLNVAQFKGGAQEVLERAKNFYFPYFKIRASVVPISGKKGFDEIRGMNVKRINYHVETYNIHAYSLAIPGVSTGQNFKNFVFKTYNYIFTGENIDIVDLDINYKVSYFQSSLKDFEATNDKKNVLEDENVKSTGGTNAKDHNIDGNLLYRSHPNVVKSEGTGKTGGTPTQLDSFLDYLTHPLADMVNIRLEILGDPAWISQSQFIPLNADSFPPGSGTGQDPDIGYWRANKANIWNSQLRCYNTDVAEPIIMLKFRMPTDFNDQTGVYELQSTQSAEFSGLYRVVQVEHNFVDGKYTNVLHITRFNNQGVFISNPVPTTSVITKDGVPTVVLKNELTKYYSAKDLTNISSNLTSIGKKYIDLISSNKSRLVKQVVNKATNKIKGFFS